MEENQVIAALQIESNEIRMVVGQFYRDRFDVIAKELVECKALDGLRIYDSAKVVNAINELKQKTSKLIGCDIKKVLLMIPAYRFKCEKRKYENLLGKRYVTYEDVHDIFKVAYNCNVGYDYEIVNVGCASYKVNGIVYPKLPINEKGEMITCELDLMCNDKMLVYDYIETVNKANLEIIDIVLDGFAAAKEEALFEQSYGNLALSIYLEGTHTTYSLIYNGRVVGGFSSDNGYNGIIKTLMEKANINYKDAYRFLFRYGVIGQASGEERLIARWENGSKTISLTYKQLQETIYAKAEELIQEFYDHCQEIIARDNVIITISGNGASLKGLQESISKKFNKKVKCYTPDELGVREARWTALLGLFYQYKDIQTINQTCKCSVDMNEYRETLLKVDKERSEGGFTDKIKNLTDKLFVESEQ